MKKQTLILAILMIFLACNVSHAESPWMKNESYVGKAAGKFGFGLKNALFFWLQPFKEAKEIKYDSEWEGFCYGIAQGAYYGVGGLIQLATFPIPADFPDIGSGLTAVPDDIEARGKEKAATAEEFPPIEESGEFVRHETKEEAVSAPSETIPSTKPTKTSTSSSRVWEAGDLLAEAGKPTPPKKTTVTKTVTRPAPKRSFADEAARSQEMAERSVVGSATKEADQAMEKALENAPQYYDKTASKTVEKKSSQSYYDKAYETDSELEDLSDVEAAIQDLLAETE